MAHTQYIAPDLQLPGVQSAIVVCVQLGKQLPAHRHHVGICTGIFGDLKAICSYGAHM
jgi:hypothetical protein